MGLSLRDQLLQAGFTQSKPEPKPQPKPEARREHPSQQRRGGGPGQPAQQRRDNRPHAQPQRKPEERKAETPKPPREAKAGGEPSLAHAYQIRAETEKREREEAQKRAQEEAARKREQRLKLAALVAGKAQNWTAVAPAGPKIGDPAAIHPFATEADCFQAAADDRQTAGVFGSDRATGNQLFGQSGRGVACRFETADP